MKKSIIAASASAAALAAMPILGAFAATGNSFTDTLRVSVQGGCTIEDAAADGQQGSPAQGSYVDRIFPAEETAGTPVYKSIAAGTIGYLNADDEGNVPTGASVRKFAVACNTDQTSGAGSVASWTVNVNAGNLSDGSHSIAPGTATSGNDSAYSIQSNATSTGTGTLSDPYEEYTYVSNNSGLFLSGPNGLKVVFNPSYRVYVSPTQEIGDYEGVVTYTITTTAGV